jgi:hypothetical protein
VQSIAAGRALGLTQRKATQGHGLKSYLPPCRRFLLALARPSCPTSMSSLDAQRVPETGAPAPQTTASREALMANAIRALAMDAVQQANSGHPGAPMGMAEIAVALWGRHLRHNPVDPSWPGRDRLVLSNGHASILL